MERISAEPQSVDFFIRCEAINRRQEIERYAKVKALFI